MLLLSGLQGSFFAPLAASFSLATLASLLVALTVTPAAAWLLLRRTEPHAEAAWLTRLKDRHEALLRRWSAFPRRVIIGSALVTLLAAAALPLFGSELMPPFREGHFVVQAYATPGTSLTAMRALGARVARDLRFGSQVSSPDSARPAGDPRHRDRRADPGSRGIRRAHLAPE